jgi:hypothetical protein
VRNGLPGDFSEQALGIGGIDLKLCSGFFDGKPLASSAVLRNGRCPWQVQGGVAWIPPSLSAA